MSSVHSNISIFVPHIGCPNMCSFCNQRHITGKHLAPNADDVDNAVQIALKSKNYDPKTTEIAFFGGSFTAINRNYMITLLNSAFKYVHKGQVSGIRISTRPDAIDIGILALLKSYGVTSIELGAQSMNDKVLKKNNRGHTAKDVINASKLIKDMGFSLGIQMMTGLYGDSYDMSIKTAREIVKLSPETVRIYPTIVLKDTDLAALYADGFYKPQTLEDAVGLATKLLEIFNNANIKVIRLGLHSIEPDSYISGPWHPAFSELCISNLYFLRVKDMLSEKGEYTLFVNPSEVSKIIGQKRINISKLHELGFDCTVKTDSKLKPYEIISERKM
ncbi:MAG: radical SAM protein [Clostridia bacterium]|nr:radical SAM protein [Clostridia bacterium]